MKTGKESELNAREAFGSVCAIIGVDVDSLQGCSSDDVQKAVLLAILDYLECEEEDAARLFAEKKIPQLLQQAILLEDTELRQLSVVAIMTSAFVPFFNNSHVAPIFTALEKMEDFLITDMVVYYLSIHRFFEKNWESLYAWPEIPQWNRQSAALGYARKAWKNFMQEGPARLNEANIGIQNDVEPDEAIAKVLESRKKRFDLIVYKMVDAFTSHYTNILPRELLAEIVKHIGPYSVDLPFADKASHPSCSIKMREAQKYVTKSLTVNQNS